MSCIAPSPLAQPAVIDSCQAQRSISFKPWQACFMAILQAYADYYDVMDTTEELVSGLVKAVKGSYQIQYHAGKTQSGTLEIYSHDTISIMV